MTVHIQRFVETVYLGPTDHRGSRVRAKNVNTGQSITRPWDYALDVRQNHDRVAAELLGATELVSSATKGGGYVYTAAQTGTKVQP